MNCRMSYGLIVPPQPTIEETPSQLTYDVKAVILVEIEELYRTIYRPLPIKGNERAIREEINLLE